MKNKPWPILVKLVVIVACFAALSRNLDFSGVARELSGIRFGYLLPAFCMLLCEVGITAAKWNVLLKRRDICAGFFNILRVVFVSNFLSLVFPTAVGADALRIYLLKRQNNSLTHATGSLIADRLLGLAALITLSLAGIPLASRYMAGNTVPATVMALSLTAFAAIVLLASNAAPLICERLSKYLAGASLPDRIKVPSLKITNFVQDVHASTMGFARVPGTMAYVFLLNILVQTTRIAQIHFLFRSLGFSVPVMYETAFIPMIVLLSLLPISYFGLGIKEGAFLFFFSAVNVPSSVSVSVSLLTYPLFALGLVPGAILFALGDRKLRDGDGVQGSGFRRKIWKRIGD